MAGLLVLVVVGTACGSTARPSVADLRAEPIFEPLAEEEELVATSIAPRRQRVGKDGRDGLVERIVAVDLDPVAVADIFERRHGQRYGFVRNDLPPGSPRTVELRGRSPTGARIVVVASYGRPIPLYLPLADVPAFPARRMTSVVVAVVSDQ